MPLFLSGISEIIRIRAERKGIAFYLEYADDLPNGVLGDEKRLRQILLNLLGNAVKFTDKGNVTLKVEARTLASNALISIHFKIEDTGIGISPENLETIFDPFQQVGDRERQIKGTGLGLAISRNLVKLMGGAIAAKKSNGFRHSIWL